MYAKRWTISLNAASERSSLNLRNRIQSVTFTPPYTTSRARSKADKLFYVEFVARSSLCSGYTQRQTFIGGAMSQIRAVVVDPSVPGRVAIKSVPAPTPRDSEALVRVEAFSLTLGEVRRTQKADAGWQPGWDIAGVGEKAAADGSGPGAGTRVVALMVDHGWAELAAVPTSCG